MRDQIAQIPESAWQTLPDYPDDGEAQIAETTYDGKRMIVWPEELSNAKPRFPTPPWNQR